MRSSRWDAQGNIYLVTEESQTEHTVRAEVGDADGVLEVLRHGDDWLEITIWNPDGSRAEMSGNGTRIAARWLAERSDAGQISVRVGPREVAARLLPDGRVEQDLGEVVVSPPEEVAGVRFVAVDVGNPHAVVDGDPADLPRIGPLLESARTLPAADERPGRRASPVRERSRRVSGSAAWGRRPHPDRARSPWPRRSAGRRPWFGFPAGPCTCGSREAGRS